MNCQHSREQQHEAGKLRPGRKEDYFATIRKVLREALLGKLLYFFTTSQLTCRSSGRPLFMISEACVYLQCIGNECITDVCLKFLNSVDKNVLLFFFLLFKRRLKLKKTGLEYELNFIFFIVQDTCVIQGYIFLRCLKTGSSMYTSIRCFQLVTL